MYSSQEHHIISSSDDEVTVVPLKLIRSNLLIVPEPPEDPNSYEVLHKYSMEKCEFCDCIFHCRYDLIMHNAEHIIVPLINQKTYKCNVCLHIFTTEQDLHLHRYLKHVSRPNVKQSFREETDVKCEVGVDVPKVLENLVKTEPIVRCDDSVTMLLKSNNLKSRLIFEEDDDDVICLDSTESSPPNTCNFNTNCDNLILDIVNNKLEQTLNGVHTSRRKQSAAQKLKVLLPSEVNLEKSPPSVHYKQLLKPGLYRCKRCTKTFPNRYTHVLHETDHIKFNKNIKANLCKLCDRYISGGQEALAKHTGIHHPSSDLTRKLNVSVCRQCNLQYHNKLTHAKHYHETFTCNYCYKRYLNSDDLSKHYNDCKNTYQALFKTYTDKAAEKKNVQTDLDQNYVLKVCEVCALFFKDRQHLKYICIGENSKLECNQICERCNKEAYVIKFIKRVRVNMRFKGECKVRTLSNNENRLKNIQQRLKLMNKLSRF